MNMAKASANSWLSSARASSREEKRAPTPVREITPTMMPAQAQTAMICTDMEPPISKAR